MLCSVVRNSNPDPLDVMFARSTNGGSTWSNPIRVNDDLSISNWQWLGTMSVAPNGRIDAIWLDTRNDPGGYDSELFYAYSDDGGATFSPNVVLSPPFDPHVGWPQQNKMGDYFHMRSDDPRRRPRLRRHVQRRTGRLLHPHRRALRRRRRN